MPIIRKFFTSSALDVRLGQSCFPRSMSRPGHAGKFIPPNPFFAPLARFCEFAHMGYGIFVTSNHCNPAVKSV